METEVGELKEDTLPPFDEVISGIKNSIPVFVMMPDHSSVNTPFKVSPVETITRMAEVLLCCIPFWSDVFQIYQSRNRNDSVLWELEGKISEGHCHFCTGKKIQKRGKKIFGK